MSMTKDYIEEVGIAVEAKSGTSLYNARRAALVLALERGTKVVLKHSDHGEYTLCPSIALNATMNQ